MTPTPDQATALGEITSARRRGAFHLLTGSAGTGKTTLMQDVVREFRRRCLRVDVLCQTVHSLLSLKPYADGRAA